MATALIRRWTWGVIQEHGPTADEIASIRIATLVVWPEQISPAAE